MKIIFLVVLLFGRFSYSQTESTPENTPDAKTPVDITYTAINFGYFINPKMVLPATASTTTASESGTLDVDVLPSFKIGVEYSHFNQNSWNNGVKVDYAKMKFDSLVLRGDVSAPLNLPVDGGLTLLSVGYAGKYRWEKFYFPIEAAIVSSTNDSTGWFTKKIESNLFVSIGFGVALNDKFMLELTSNAYAIRAATATSGALTISSKEGYLNFLQLTGKLLL